MDFGPAMINIFLGSLADLSSPLGQMALLPWTTTHLGPNPAFLRPTHSFHEAFPKGVFCNSLCMHRCFSSAHAGVRITQRLIHAPDRHMTKFYQCSCMLWFGKKKNLQLYYWKLFLVVIGIRKVLYTGGPPMQCKRNCVSLCKKYCVT